MSTGGLPSSPSWQLTLKIRDTRYLHTLLLAKTAENPAYFIHYATFETFVVSIQGQARGIWTYHLKKAQYHEGAIIFET